jgi:hypothetical protein
VLSSTNQAGPGDTDDYLSHRRPAISQAASAAKKVFAPLTIEEQETYRNWRLATLAFYGVLAVFIVALSLAIGSPGPTNVKNNPAYSAITSAGQYRPR